MEKVVWVLSITDTGLGDDGVLTSWGIEYCGVEKLSLANENLITPYSGLSKSCKKQDYS
jgi:subtilisin-like proprotein convertase family protein